VKREPHYIPPPGGKTTGATFSRQRIDLTGRSWDRCVFDECTLVLYQDSKVHTEITNAEFYACCFVGDREAIEKVFAVAGMDPYPED
jgi:hypothetical protein